MSQKRQVNKILPLRVGLSWWVSSSLTESFMKRVSKNTLEHPQAARASQNITQLNHPSRHPNPKDTKIHSTDTARCLQIIQDNFQTLLKMHDRVRLEPILPFGKTVKGKTFFMWRFWDIKISKSDYLPLPKMIEFCHFSYFSCLSEKNYNLQSFWITLYKWNHIGQICN